LEGSSDGILSIIDNEVKDLILQQKKRAEDILKKKKQDLIAVAEALLKYETLDAEQVTKVLSKQSLDNTTEKETSYTKVNLSTFGLFIDEESNKDSEKRSEDKKVTKDEEVKEPKTKKTTRKTTKKTE